MAENHDHEHDDHEGGHDHDHGDGAGAATATEEAEEETKLEPTVEVEEVGAWKRRIKVEIAGEKVSGDYEKQLKELSRSANVPGFRKGHVPRKLLLNRFGEALGGDVKSGLLMRGLEEALEGSGLEAVSEPLFGPKPPPAPDKEGYKEPVAAEGEEKADKEGDKEGDGEAERPPTPAEASVKYLKDLELDPEKAFAFEFTVEVKPTFDLPEYKELELTRRELPVTDERVEAFINAIRRDEADYEPVEEGAIQPGDRLTVKASMECEGEAAWEAENEIAHVTDESLLGLPGIVRYAEIEGMKLDDEKTVDVKVVDGFQKEELRGKDAKLTLKVQEIKRPVLPPLDDEAAQRLGAPDAESLRAQARDRLGARAQAEAHEGLEKQIGDALVEAADFELPEGLLERQSRTQEIRQMLRFAQMGIPPDKLEEEHRESIRSSARESTDRSLKLSLILGKIAEAEKIEVTDDDLENEIHRYAISQGKTPVSVRSELQRSGKLDDLQAEMLSAKVVNFIVEHADIKDAQEGPGDGSSEGGAR